MGWTLNFLFRALLLLETTLSLLHNLLTIVPLHSTLQHKEKGRWHFSIVNNYCPTTVLSVSTRNSICEKLVSFSCQILSRKVPWQPHSQQASPPFSSSNSARLWFAKYFLVCNFPVTFIPVSEPKPWRFHCWSISYPACVHAQRKRKMYCEGKSF